MAWDDTPTEIRPCDALAEALPDPIPMNRLPLRKIVKRVAQMRQPDKERSDEENEQIVEDIVEVMTPYMVQAPTTVLQVLKAVRIKIKANYPDSDDFHNLNNAIGVLEEEQKLRENVQAEGDEEGNGVDEEIVGDIDSYIPPF